MRRTFEFFAVVTPGLEALSEQELERSGAKVSEISHGGVAFSADLLGACALHLNARTLGRIWLRLGDFRARSFPDLYNGVAAIDWPRHLAVGTPVRIKASATASRLNHVGRIQDTAMAGIRHHLALASEGPSEGSQAILVRMEQDRCTVSLDMSGDHLHKRGYREATGKAPLRETMAAALLQWAGWDGTTPLLDPMCGVGTLLIEGAWMASGRAPGLGRSFAFERWPRYDQYGWRRLKAEAEAAASPAAEAAPAISPSAEATPAGEAASPRPLILGADRDPEAISAAIANVARAGLADAISLTVADVSDLTPPEGVPPGLIVCNAPYGERLGSPKALASVYKRLGKAARQFEGWRLLLLHTRPELRQQFEGACARKPSDKLIFHHGGLKVTAALYRI